MGLVVALHLSEGRSFSKQAVEQVDLIAGVGVAGDAHAGSLVQHRSRVAADPDQPNLRQVHLIASELLLLPFDPSTHHDKLVVLPDSQLDGTGEVVEGLAYSLDAKFTNGLRWQSGV